MTIPITPIPCSMIDFQANYQLFHFDAEWIQQPVYQWSKETTISIIDPGTKIQYYSDPMDCSEYNGGLVFNIVSCLKR